MKVLCLFALFGVLLGLAADPCFALQKEFQGNVVVFGDGREFNNGNFSSLEYSQDLFFLVGTQISLSESDFTLRVRPELRALQSRSFSLPSYDPYRLSVRSPERGTNLRLVSRSGVDHEIQLELERLDLAYQGKIGEAYLGRRPVSLGVLRVLPVWNKFSRPLPTVSGYPLVFNQDVAGARMQWESLSVQAFHLFEGSAKPEDVTLVEPVFYAPWGEIHALASRWWGRSVLGFASAHDVGGMTLRNESLFVLADQADPKKKFEVQAGAGGEYAFSEKWSGVLEFMYLSTGATRTLDYGLVGPSQFSSLKGVFYGVFQLKFQASPLWALTGGAFVNGVDWSQYVLMKAEHSMAENLDLFFDVNLPVGREGAEFANRSVFFSDGTTLGVPAQIDAGLRYSF